LGPKARANQRWRTGHIAPRVLWPQNRTPLTLSPCRAWTCVGVGVGVGVGVAV